MRDAWVSAGMFWFGVFKAKNKRGAVSQIAAYSEPGAWKGDRWSFDAAAELGFGAWLGRSVHM